MNIIWNKGELYKIRRIILSKAGYSLGENNSLIKGDKKSCFQERFFVMDEAVKSKLEDLLYIESREDVFNILNSLKGIEADYNNPLHFGLIASLSKIDTNDYTSIFEIYNQIISQFARVISKVAKEMIANLNSQNISEIINLISNSSEETEAERQIRDTMSKTFSYVPQLREIPIYNDLIECYDSIIKDKLLGYLYNELITRKKAEEKLEEKDYDYYMLDQYKKYQRNNMNSLKTHYRKFY